MREALPTTAGLLEVLAHLEEVVDAAGWGDRSQRLLTVLDEAGQVILELLYDSFDILTSVDEHFAQEGGFGDRPDILGLVIEREWSYFPHALDPPAKTEDGASDFFTVLETSEEWGLATRLLATRLIPRDLPDANRCDYRMAQCVTRDGRVLTVMRDRSDNTVWRDSETLIRRTPPSRSAVPVLWDYLRRPVKTADPS